MGRVNISVPDDVLVRARAAGINVSGVATAALAEELDRRAKIAGLVTLLSELDDELGPVPDAELDAARRWAADLVGSPPVAEQGVQPTSASS